MKILLGTVIYFINIVLIDVYQFAGGKRDWDKLEERLEKLKEHANRNRVSVPNDEAAHIAELEQRLANLRGVPVEVIRRPRLVSYFIV